MVILGLTVLGNGINTPFRVNIRRISESLVSGNPFLCDMLGYIGFKLIQGIIRFVPLSFLYILSTGLSWVLQYVLKYRSTTIEQNLRLAYPDKSSETLMLIKKKFYLNLADTTLESIKGPFLKKAELKKRMLFKNPEVIDKNKFVLLVGGHQGNWEWGGLAVNLWFEQSVFGVYKPMKNKSIDQDFKKSRKKWDLTLLTMRETSRWLVNRPEESILVLIADQSPGNAKTALWVPFYNKASAFNIGPEKIATRTNSPIYFYSVKRIGRGMYEVEFSLLEKNPNLTRPGDITIAFKNALEKSIDEQPEDWLWSHKRWKKNMPMGVQLHS